MTIISTVVIIPNAEDESDAIGQAEELLEVSAIQPYGEGPFNENGVWESFAVGWLDYGMPVNNETDEEMEAIQVKHFDVDDFFLADNEDEYDDTDDDEPVFIPEALVLPDGKWMDEDTLDKGVNWKEYFMETMHGLAGDNWLVFIEAAD